MEILAPEILAGIFSHSGTACAITDNCGKLLFSNEPFDKRFKSLAEKNELISAAASSDGKACALSDGKIYGFNVIKHGSSRIIEVFECDDIKTLLASSEVRSFLSYVFSRLRSSAAAISTASDEIYALLTDKSFSDADKTADGIISRLNEIDGGVVSLLSEIITPEQLVYLLDNDGSPSATAVSEETERVFAAASKSKLVGKSGVKLSLDKTDSIYARVNKNSFRTVLAELIGECLKGKPERVEVQLKREDDLTACVTVNSIGGLKSGDLSGGGIFLAYVCDTFCDRYGGSFTKSNSDGGLSFKISFRTVPPTDVNVANKKEFAAPRLDNVSVIFGDEIRYKEL